MTNQAVGRMLGEINVTPMIDILLVLLIIFMVIAPVAPRGLAADLPQRSARANATPEAPIVVRIMSDPQWAVELQNRNEVQMT